MKKVRNSFNMTQKAFGLALGVSEKTIEKWEKEGNTINESSKKLIYLIDKHNYLMKDLYEFIDENNNENKYTLSINKGKNIKSIYGGLDESIENSKEIQYISSNKFDSNKALNYS